MHRAGLDRAVGRASKELGLRIAELRAARGWTQAELASEINDEVGTVSRIERGLGNPTTRSLVCIALALGVTMAELFAPPADTRPRRPGRPRKR